MAGLRALRVGHHCAPDFATEPLQLLPWGSSALVMQVAIGRVVQVQIVVKGTGSESANTSPRYTFAMSAIIETFTAEQLLAMPDDGWRYELIEGELHRMAPAGYEHGRVTMNLSGRILEHVRSRSLGVVVTAETGFIIKRDPDTVRAPDVAFIAAARADAARNVRGYFPGAPDLAVEVVSPSDTFSDVEEKVFEWLGAGSVAVVVVDPRRRRVTLNRSEQDIRVLGEGDTLDLSFVLPDFSIPVTQLFE